MARRSAGDLGIDERCEPGEVGRLAELSPACVVRGASLCDNVGEEDRVGAYSRKYTQRRVGDGG